MSSSYNNACGLPELIEVVFDEIFIKGTNLLLGNIYIQFVRALEFFNKIELGRRNYSIRWKILYPDFF